MKKLLLLGAAVLAGTIAFSQIGTNTKHGRKKPATMAADEKGGTTSGGGITSEGGEGGSGVRGGKTGGSHSGGTKVASKTKRDGDSGIGGKPAKQGKGRDGKTASTGHGKTDGGSSSGGGKTEGGNVGNGRVEGTDGDGG